MSGIRIMLVFYYDIEYLYPSLSGGNKKRDLVNHAEGHVKMNRASTNKCQMNHTQVMQQAQDEFGEAKEIHDQVRGSGAFEVSFMQESDAGVAVPEREGVSSASSDEKVFNI